MRARSSIVALMSAHNEADVIGAVVRSLNEQGIRIHLIDDGSSDDTVRVAESASVPGLLSVEHRPPGPTFNWEAILERKEELAVSLDADWFIHHDADEFRESPWLGLSLSEAIGEVDRLEYNAIDFEVLQFRPVDDSFEPGGDVRRQLLGYQRSDPWDRLQIKCWKRTGQSVDLRTSGGHAAAFVGRRIFPVRFLLRHYPIRSESHGRRKIFSERLARFAPAERERNWHVQYDTASPDHLLVSPSDVRLFDPIGARLSLLESPASDRTEDLEPRRSVEARLAAGITDLRDRIRSQSEEIDALNAEVTRAKAELDRYVMEANAREAAVRRYHDDRHRSDLNQLQAYVEEESRLRGELSAMRSSVSWRVSAPIRWVGSLVVSPRQPVPAENSPAVQPGSVRPSWPMNRLSPVSDSWGLDRGTPVDRVYVERFLNARRFDIHGRVLEVKDRGYTSRFGHDVTDSQVLDVDAKNALATVVADLTDIPDQVSGFDCFILTQTLHIVYDIHAALRGAARILAPGGVLLCTLPAVSRVNDEDGGLESGDYWRLTQAAVRRLFDDDALWSELSVQTVGNVSVCAAFLYGLAAQDLDSATFDFDDPWFPLIHCVRAVRRA